MEKKIDIWEEFNMVYPEDTPIHVIDEMSLLFSNYYAKKYELKDGWLFKLENPYFLTQHDEAFVMQYCTKRDKLNYILMKQVGEQPNAKTGLQRPGIQKVAHSGIQTRRF